MKYIKRRDQFLKDKLNENLTNDIRWGGSYLGRLINTGIRLMKSGYSRGKIEMLPKKLKDELEYLIGLNKIRQDDDINSEFKEAKISSLLLEIEDMCKRIDETEDLQEKKEELEDTIDFIENTISTITDEEDQELKKNLEDFLNKLKEDLKENDKQLGLVPSNKDTNNDEGGSKKGDSLIPTPDDIDDSEYDDTIDIDYEEVEDEKEELNDYGRPLLYAPKKPKKNNLVRGVRYFMPKPERITIKTNELTTDPKNFNYIFALLIEGNKAVLDLAMNRNKTIGPKTTLKYIEQYDKYAIVEGEGKNISVIEYGEAKRISENMWKITKRIKIKLS